MIKIFNKKYLGITLAVFLFVLVCAVPVLSLADNDPISTTLENPIESKTVIELIKKILEGVIKIGMPIIALMLVYSGFLFVMARGNKGELETAKRNFMYVVIGAAILISSWGIAQLISETVQQL